MTEDQTVWLELIQFDNYNISQQSKQMSCQYQEFSILNFSVLINQIKLIVRFPCKVFYQIKINPQTFTKKSQYYQLSEDKVDPHELLDIKIQIDKNKGKFVNTKVYLLMFVASANGEVPIGNSTIQLSRNGDIIGLQESVHKTVAIQKCPDKNAEVNLEIKSKIVSQSKRVIKQRSQKKVRLISQSRTEQSKEKSQHQTFKMIKKSITNNKKPGHHRLNKTEQKQEDDDSSFEGSQISGDSSFNNKNHLKYFEHSRNSNDGPLVSKVKRLETQKMQMQKQMLKLKAELLNCKNQRVSSPQQDLNQLKEQLKELGNANFVLQQKQRQLKQQIKIKQQNIAFLNQAKSESEEKYMAQHADKVKQYQSQSIELKKKIQQLRQYSQQLKIEADNWKHRLETKEQRYTKEIERLQAKNKQIEKQRMKLIQGFQDSLDTFHETEKKKQIDKISKEQQYQKAIKSYQSTIEQLNSRIKELTRENYQLKGSQQKNKLSEAHHSSETKDLRKKLEIYTSQNTQSQEIINSLRADLNNAHIELVKLKKTEQKNRQLSEQLEVLKTNKENDKKEWQSKEHSYMEIIEQKDNILIEKQHKIEGLFEINGKTQQKNKQALEQLAKQLREKHEKVLTLEKWLQSKQVELKQSFNRINEIQEQLANQYRQLERCEQQKVSLYQEYQYSLTDIDRINNQMAQQKQIYIEQIHRLKQDVEDTKQLREKDKIIEQLKKKMKFMEENKNTVALQLQNCLQGWQAEKMKPQQSHRYRELSLYEIMNEIDKRVDHKRIY